MFGLEIVHSILSHYKSYKMLMIPFAKGLIVTVDDYINVKKGVQ